MNNTPKSILLGKEHRQFIGFKVVKPWLYRVQQYDMASDAQKYAILIERLLKADKDRHIVWPHRPFEVSLLGIAE